MSGRVIKGRVLKYGDDIDTDRIYPHRFLGYTKPQEMAEHAMADVDPDFVKKVREGDVIVAGKNFGCGSARDHAVLSIKYAGISAAVAESFARIFFRNAITYGLPVIECRGVTEKFDEGDEIEINVVTGKVKNVKTGQILIGTQIPAPILKRLEEGGLIPYLKKRYRK